MGFLRKTALHNLTLTKSLILMLCVRCVVPDDFLCTGLLKNTPNCIALELVANGQPLPQIQPQFPSPSAALAIAPLEVGAQVPGAQGNHVPVGQVPSPSPLTVLFPQVAPAVAEVVKAPEAAPADVAQTPQVNPVAALEDQETEQRRNLARLFLDELLQGQPF